MKSAILSPQMAQIHGGDQLAALHAPQEGRWRAGGGGAQVGCPNEEKGMMDIISRECLLLEASVYDVRKVFETLDLNKPSSLICAFIVLWLTPPSQCGRQRWRPTYLHA